jgi:deoxyribonuclease-4
MSDKLFLGAHLFGSSTFYQKFEMARFLGLYSFQIFTASNLSYNLDYVLKKETVDSFQQGKKAFSDIVVFSHACYLLNIARSDTDNYDKSYKALCLEMERCQVLGIDAVVLHPGSSENKKNGLQIVANTINKIYQEYDFSVSLFLESSAGQGNTLPVTIEEMVQLYENLSEKAKKKVKFTIDTCHVHAAGCDFSRPENVYDYFDRYNRLLGIETIGLLHINDSLYESGSKKDRHTNIGKGTIGLDGFDAIINHPHLKYIYKILETKVSENIFFKDDIAMIKKLYR